MKFPFDSIWFTYNFSFNETSDDAKEISNLSEETLQEAAV
jgi:hypothetical protein